jgi:hypothetical protein
MWWAPWRRTALGYSRRWLAAAGWPATRSGLPTDRTTAGMTDAAAEMEFQRWWEDDPARLEQEIDALAAAAFEATTGRGE